MAKDKFNKPLDQDAIGNTVVNLFEFWREVAEAAGYHLYPKDTCYGVEVGRLSGWGTIAPCYNEKKASQECLDLTRKHFCSTSFNFEFSGHAKLGFVFELEVAEEFDFNCLYEIIEMKKYLIDEIKADDIKGMEELFEYFFLKNFNEEGKKRILYFAEELRRAKPENPDNTKDGPA